MSGRQNAPLLPPDQAAQLLDGVIFTRVAELIDLPGLYDLEAMLALQVESLGAGRERSRALAKSMIDRALLRVARTSRQWTCDPCDDSLGVATTTRAPQADGSLKRDRPDDA